MVKLFGAYFLSSVFSRYKSLQCDILFLGLLFCRRLYMTEAVDQVLAGVAIVSY